MHALNRASNYRHRACFVRIAVDAGLMRDTICEDCTRIDPAALCCPKGQFLGARDNALMRIIPAAWGCQTNSFLSGLIEDQKMKLTRMRMVCLVSMQLVIAMPVQSARAQETAKGLLAIQARAQGYRCDNPVECKKRCQEIRTGRVSVGSSVRA